MIKSNVTTCKFVLPNPSPSLHSYISISPKVYHPYVGVQNSGSDKALMCYCEQHSIRIAILIHLLIKVIPLPHRRERNQAENRPTRNFTTLDGQ